MATPKSQYVLNDEGRETAVTSPIEMWREIGSERETAYLLRSETMRQRLLEAKERSGGIPFEEASAKLGIHRRATG